MPIGSNRHVWPGPDGANVNDGPVAFQSYKKKKKKKKKVVLDIQPCLVCMSEQSSVFFFFFFFLALFGPGAEYISVPAIRQFQTCRLLAIGTFDLGPDGANGNGGPWHFNVQKKKKNVQPCFGCMSEQSSFFFFFFRAFFLASLAWVPLNLPIGNQHVWL